MRLVPFVLALVVLAVTATSAGAAPASPARAGNLCGVGKSIASSLQSSGAISPSAGTSVQALGAQMKATFSKIEAAEKIVLANASGSIKGHLENVFAFDNTIYTKLKAANWNILVFAKNAQSFAAQAQKLKPDLAAIQAYFAKCK